MNLVNNARDIFDQWAKDDRASNMARGHWQVVKQAFDLIPSTRGNYLEIGTGTGYGLYHMATNQFKKGKCFGIDIAPGMVTAAREKVRGLNNVSVEQADFMKWLPADGTEFSLVFSMEVFYYFSSIQTAIDKAYSLLVPRGQFWLMVNYYAENPISLGWPEQLGTVMQLWSAQEYLEGMKKAGFIKADQRTFSSLDPKKSDHGSVTLCTVGTKG